MSKSLRTSLGKFVVTGLGTGYGPVAPGTYGSAATCLLFVLAGCLCNSNAMCLNVTMGIVAILASVACVALGGFTQNAFGKKDPGQCTVDEWAGQAITLMAIPYGVGTGDLWIVAAVGFAAFRVFDITKPPPARQFERLPLGWGVLLDDLAAGIYANITCQIVLRLFVFG